MSQHSQDANSLHPILSSDDVRGVVFDLDGTLIDSGADILHGMRLTFEQSGLGDLPQDYFPDNMHGTVDGILSSIASDMGWSLPDDLTGMRTAYLSHATAIDLERTRLYSGVLDVLQACRVAGLPMAICTNKGHAGAVAAIQKFGLLEFFGFITGSDTWGIAKPSPLPLLETIRMLGLQADNCLYFGDTSIDAACAEAADVRFVLHESGYADPALTGKPVHFAFSEWKELLTRRMQLA